MTYSSPSIYMVPMKPRFLCIHGAASSNWPIMASVIVQYLLLKRIHVYVNPHSNLCYSRVNCTSNNCSILCSLGSGSDTHSLMHIALLIETCNKDASLFFLLFFFISFAKYRSESATGIHVFPILNPPSPPLGRPRGIVWGGRREERCFLQVNWSSTQCSFVNATENHSRCKVLIRLVIKIFKLRYNILY